MEKDAIKEKIVLPESTQREILKFFMKTSIPRKIRQNKDKKSLSEKEGQENK
ncbi:MAG: hypothetical protein FWC32_05695 [Firmicutes bacterium]|nr:hypothetical protein [Bacillota bacterium]